MFKKEMPLFQSIATMVGTIIGAGILGVPYVFAKAGFLTGMVVLAVITFAMISLKLMFGETTLRTYGKHQFAGYVGKYLGTLWQRIATFIVVLGISGALLAYFVGIGEVLSAVFGGSHLLWGVLFYIIAALLVYRGLRLIKSVEFVLSLVIFAIVLIIFFISWNHIDASQISGLDWSKILLPYGVVLFACSGLVAIPEVRRILMRREHLFKKAVFWGALIPSIVYLIFAWIVVSVTGAQTTEIATIGLGNKIGPAIIIIGNIFAFFTMATSFLTSGLAVKETYNFDCKFPHWLAWLLSMSVPIIIFILGLKNFIQILGLASAIGFGVNGVLIIIIYWAARKKSQRQPEYALPRTFTFPVSIFLVLIFIGGLIYTLVDTF